MIRYLNKEAIDSSINFHLGSNVHMYLATRSTYDIHNFSNVIYA